MKRDFLAAETFNGTFPWEPRFKAINGFDMHYIDEGSGEPIVCLHGMPTWGYLYREFITPLSAFNRVIVPDHMGFGKSDVPDDLPYTMAQHVENLTQLLLSLDLSDITLVMHDWGGPIGFGFAVDHPDLVKRLVILNTSVGVMKEGSKAWYDSIPNYDEFFGNMGTNVGQLLRLAIYHQERVTEDLIAAYAAPFPEPEYCAGPLAFPKDIPIGPGHQSTAAMQHVRDSLDVLADKPKIAIWGTQDIVFPPAAIDRWVRFYPDMAVHRIEDASHFLQEDAPAEIVEQIQAFCT
jgi:haloalkane dehalogenase